MHIISEPRPENHYLGEHAELILPSLFRMTGWHLVDPERPDTERYRSLFEAPFCVVTHNTEADPVFNYGNRTALLLFEMKWEAFTRLLSRFSAEQQVREERERLLARVAEHGYTYVGAPRTGSSAAGVAACCRRPRWLYFMLISAQRAAYADPPTG